MGDLSRNFSRSEFACKGTACCSHSAPITTELITALEALRDKVGMEIRIMSGFRCRTHNKAVGGALNSYHTLGMAADIQCAHLKPAELYAVADKLGVFGGVAIYPTFVHVDVRKSSWRADYR